MKDEIWNVAKKRLAVGRTLKDGAYKVTEHKPTAIVLTRVATGSTVRVTRGKVEKTAGRLLQGPVAFRSASYTVAEEFGIIAAIPGVIVDNEKKEYRF